MSKYCTCDSRNIHHDDDGKSSNPLVASAMEYVSVASMKHPSIDAPQFVEVLEASSQLIR